MAALFTLGRIVISPVAERLLAQLHINPASQLLRHVTGDWGDVSEDQQRANAEAAIWGGRILSIYGTGSRRLCVMTESDRSMTTIFKDFKDA
jgi:hypothetical protein